jgi:CHAT domain-containing protein
VPAWWRPRQLFLAPDGALAALPFEILRTDDGAWLMDQHVLSYVSTSRDLLRFGSRSDRPCGQAVVVADPDFDLTTTELPADEAGQALRVNASHPLFSPLPGTRKEGERVARILGVEPWLGVNALKGRLRSVHSPLALHFATHSFFLGSLAIAPRTKPRTPPAVTRDIAIASAVEAPRLTGPDLETALARSGLVLAGANTWLRDAPLPATAENGILTGEDVLGLDILDTQLVVLAGCSTASGLTATGEGVLGLRWAFAVAGVQTLVVSLWDADDLSTAILMERFYANLVGRGLDCRAALREAQQPPRTVPQPVLLGAFICQGDPGPIASPAPSER